MACLLIEYNVKCVLIKPVCTETDLLCPWRHTSCHTQHKTSLYSPHKNNR